MVNKIDVLNKLQALGLSKNQSLIYLVLIQKGELRIQDISKYTSIPRSSVYENLKKLSDLGIIEQTVEHKHVTLKAYPISSLKHKFHESILKTQNLLENLPALEKTIRVFSKDSHISPVTAIRYYKGVAGARQMFWNTLSTKDTVLVYSAYGRSKYLGKKFYKDFVQESKERNIKEKVLINPTAKAVRLIKRDTGTSLARTKPTDIRFLSEEKLPINEETLMYNNVYAQITLNSSGINGFEIESENFIKLQRSMFNTLWDLAENIPWSE